MHSICKSIKLKVKSMTNDAIEEAPPRIITNYSICILHTALTFGRNNNFILYELMFKNRATTDTVD